MEKKKFDPKERAGALLKQLGQNPGAPLNQALARSAIELALREAYGFGMADARGAPRVVAQASAPRQAGAPPKRAEETPCAHEWEDAFLDGRALGSKCVHCGILQRDVQERCDHYFVKVGGRDVCVACRKGRRSGRG